MRMLRALVPALCTLAALAAPLPRVAILATGGTIAGSGASATATVGYKPGALGVEHLVRAVPELKRVAQVQGEQLFAIGSADMDDAHWLKLARRVNEVLASPEVDGVVITHGTDTLEETAYFLDLVVRSAKPVVLVGSMRPATALSADGPMNLYDAVRLAGSSEAKGKGVLVTLNGMIHAAREVTKTNTMLPDTFRAPELGALGYMTMQGPRFYRTPLRRHTADSAFDVTKLDRLPAVDIVYSYAGATRAAIDAFVAAGDRGIVHAGTGDGSVPTALYPVLQEASRKGVAVVRASRTGNGPTNPTDEDTQDGLVVSDTLNPQKARILLKLALTRTQDPKEIQRIFDTY